MSKKQLSTDAKTRQAELEIIERHRRIVGARKRLKREERGLAADTVEHLRGQIESRSGSRDQVRRAVARYAREVLGLSSSMASLRVSAALVASKRPATIADIRDGRVTFAALKALEPYIHFPKLLNAAVGKTRREVNAKVEAHLEALGLETSPLEAGPSLQTRDAPETGAPEAAVEGRRAANAHARNAAKGRRPIARMGLKPKKARKRARNRRKRAKRK